MSPKIQNYMFNSSDSSALISHSYIKFQMLDSIVSPYMSFEQLLSLFLSVLS